MYRLVLARQPCTLASTTGYRVYRLVLATQPCTLASTTGYRVYRLILATQPCTLTSTTVYRVYRLVLGYTALYTCFNNWLQSVPAGTGYTALYTCFNLLVAKSTNRVLATQSLLYSASPNWLHKKKKKNSWVTPACQFCQLQRFTGYRKLPVTETWYLTALPKVSPFFQITITV